MSHLRWHQDPRVSAPSPEMSDWERQHLRDTIVSAITRAGVHALSQREAAAQAAVDILAMPYLEFRAWAAGTGGYEP